MLGPAVPPLAGRRLAPGGHKKAGRYFYRMREAFRKRGWLVWGLLYALSVFLTLNRHAKSELFTYHAELWSDKAGYYVYLPATFLYGFEARRFPAGINQRTGGGFDLDLATNRVGTKYPYGVALLQAPFWLAAHALHPAADGYSRLEQKSVDVAAATYFVLGLCLLYGTLRRGGYSAGVVALTLAALALGTNLAHYALYETGMCHIYSFAGFALLLALLLRPGPPWWSPATPAGRRWGIAATAALLTVIRPIDGLLVLPLLLWPGAARPVAAAGAGRAIGAVLAMGLLLWLPQLVYYRYLHGSWLVYSYGGEGFPYWLHPRLAKIWLAPNNGSLLYNPLLALVLGPGLWQLARQRGWWAAWVGGSWLLLSYVYAAWWDGHLGCGYGGRGFVDSYPLLAWAAAAGLAWLLARPAAGRWVGAALVAALVGYNLYVMLHFDRCFQGQGDWDWPAYWRYLT